MAWGKRLVLLLLVVVVVDGFNSTEFGQSSGSAAMWVHDVEDVVLRKMNLNWENKLLFLVPQSHDMLDWVGDIFRNRKNTLDNISWMEMSDDDDKGDGTQEDFPFAVNNRELSAGVEVPSTAVGTRASNPAGLMSRKISESTHRAPMSGVLLTLGSSPSEMGRTLASMGPLWPNILGSRGIGPSLLSAEDFRVKNGSIVLRNDDWKSYGDSLKKPAVILKEGQMHGKERATDGKKGKGKNRAEKQLIRKKDRNRFLQTKVVLQFSQQQ